MAYFNGKKVFFSPRIHMTEGGGGSAEIEEVSALPDESEALIGKVYKLTSTGEMYAFLTASQFSTFDAVPTIASESEAAQVIDMLMGYDTCHTLFTAKLNHSGEIFRCIVYTNSDYDPYTGRISSAQGDGDYGEGYDRGYYGAYDLVGGYITFENLVRNAGLNPSYYDGNGDAADTVSIISITELGKKLFDFSTGGKVNITTGKIV